jgi:hypothetical protein
LGTLRSAPGLRAEHVPPPGTRGLSVAQTLVLASVSKLRQYAYMAKTASLTVRIPEILKRRIEARAEREHRSVSAQVEHELELLFASERDRSLHQAGRLLGRYRGRRLPSEKELRDVRETLWSRLSDDKQ